MYKKLRLLLGDQLNMAILMTRQRIDISKPAFAQRAACRRAVWPTRESHFYIRHDGCRGEIALASTVARPIPMKIPVGIGIESAPTVLWALRVEISAQLLSSLALNVVVADNRRGGDLG